MKLTKKPLSKRALRRLLIEHRTWRTLIAPMLKAIQDSERRP